MTGVRYTDGQLDCCRPACRDVHHHYDGRLRTMVDDRVKKIIKDFSIVSNKALGACRRIYGKLVFDRRDT